MHCRFESLGELAASLLATTPGAVESTLSGHAEEDRVISASACEVSSPVYVAIGAHCSQDVSRGEASGCMA
jgi:hypothetical protein